MRRLCSTIVLAALFAGAAFAANPHDPQKRFTAADQAWARTLLLQRADLPGAGWTSKKSTGDNSTCKSFNPDESKLVETGEQQSREFSRGGGFVTSMAAIFKTTKDAENGWNLEAKTQILDCLAEALGQTSTGSATVKIAARGKLAFPHVAQRNRRLLRPSCIQRARDQVQRGSALHPARPGTRESRADVAVPGQAAHAVARRARSQPGCDAGPPPPLATSSAQSVLEQDADALAPVDSADCLREERCDG